MKASLLIFVLALTYSSGIKKSHNDRSNSFKDTNHDLDSRDENHRLAEEGLRYLQPLIPEVVQYVQRKSNSNNDPSRRRSLNKQRQKLLKKADTLLQPISGRLNEAHAKSLNARGPIKDAGHSLAKFLYNIPSSLHSIFTQLLHGSKITTEKPTTNKPIVGKPTTTTSKPTTTKTTTTFATTATTNVVPSYTTPESSAETSPNTLIVAPNTDPEESLPFPVLPPPRHREETPGRAHGRLIHITPEQLRKSERKKGRRQNAAARRT